jgi:methylenetetrahydrofolate dehydrogenase (NADP+)/methenyltetrahydrofolate cyclohydrolase
MSARILDGRALAAELREELLVRCGALHSVGVRPRLVVLMVGENESSFAYIRGIRRLGDALGIDVTVDFLPLSIDVALLRARLGEYGNDPAVHGIMIQQPLPFHLPIRHICDAVPVHKDVDGANPVNQGRLAFASGALFVPATPAAIMFFLERSEKWPLRSREVTVIGRSNVVGLPVSLLIMAQDATLTVTHKETVDLRPHTRNAEILIVAAGEPNLVTGDMLRPGATVIDVGTTVVDGTLVGDVHLASAVRVASEITPVPGGVGPVTNIALMHNLVKSAERAQG